MHNLIFSFILFSVEFLIAFNYFKNMFEYKTNYKKSLLIVILNYLAMLVIYCLFPSYEIINVSSFALFNFISIYFGFNSRIKNALFHCFMLTIIMYLTEAITVFFISSLFGLSSVHYQENFYLLIIDAIICKTLYFIVSKIISIFAARKANNEQSGRYWVLIILPISSLSCTLLLHYLLSQNSVSESVNIISSALSVIQLFSNIIVFWIYENTQKNNIKMLELQMTNQKNVMDMTYLKLLEEKNNASGELIHDIKNHLMTINSIALSKNVSEYIKNIYGEIEIYSYIGKTKNRMLDLILNKYTTICKNKNIILNIETFSENLSFINDADLSTVLNNLFDNSIEAVEKCEEKEITFIVKKNENGCRIVDMSNKCAQKPIFKNQRLLSTKKDSGYHGIGTKNIEKTVRKYKGEIEWIYNEENETFQVIILFP